MTNFVWDMALEKEKVEMLGLSRFEESRKKISGLGGTRRMRQDVNGSNVDIFSWIFEKIFCHQNMKKKLSLTVRQRCNLKSTTGILYRKQK
jgi:hypothetical protein